MDIEDEDEGGEYRWLKSVDTAKYVEERIVQISELLEVVDNSALRPGEVTSGPRTTFQRLPRHMRRRAMSHNVKRLPRDLRCISQKSSKAHHRQKPPCRKWRRRPSRILKKLHRLRLQNVWLETHIWHAKRFRMANLWGWKLPIQSYQRGFRPTYRNAFKSTVVFDLSYFCCVQLTSNTASGGVEAIVGLLSQMCANGVSLSFGFSPAIEFGLETSAMLYAPGKYPFGFIGPVRFSWSIDSKSDKFSLQIWSHPSTHSEIVQCIVSLTDSKLLDSSKQKESKDLNISDLKKVSVPQQILSTPTYISPKFTVTDLRHDLVRIGLIGPKVFSLLSVVLHLVSDEELEQVGHINSYRDSHHYWRDFVCMNHSTLLAGNFRSGTTISLMVEDPRLFRGHAYKSLNLDQMGEKVESSIGLSYVSPPLPDLSLFWDNEFCKNQFLKRLTPVQLEEARSLHLLGGLKSTAFKIPILLVIHNVSSALTSSAQNRIDLIAPGGTGLDFWLAIQFANGRAAGLNDKISIDFESGMCTFPADCADSKAAIEYAEMNACAFKAESKKKPKNRRLKYKSRLRVKYPFNFNWSQLISDWHPTNFPCKQSNEDVDYFVIRDRRVLQKINSWFNNSERSKREIFVIEKIFRIYANSLVAIKLTHVSRGCAKRLALICLPTLDDLNALKLKKIPIIEEPKVEKKKSSILAIEKEDDSPTATTSNFMEFNKNNQIDEGIVGNRLMCLNELFPDKEKLKKDRILAKKTKRKIIVKKRKIEKQNNEMSSVKGNETQTKSSIEMDVDICQDLNSKEKYRNSCSRSVVGRVVRGDYSFVRTRGIAFGYCPLNALFSIKDTKKYVLLRNKTSKFYHFATVNINLLPSAEI